LLNRDRRIEPTQLDLPPDLLSHARPDLPLLPGQPRRIACGQEVLQRPFPIIPPHRAVYIRDHSLQRRSPHLDLRHRRRIVPGGLPGERELPLPHELLHGGPCLPPLITTPAPLVTCILNCHAKLGDLWRVPSQVGGLLAIGFRRPKPPVAQVLSPALDQGSHELIQQLLPAPMSGRAG
jgi:hypothetical protein